MDISEMTATEIADAVRQRKTTALEIAEAAIARAAETKGAFLHPDPNRLREDAKAIDRLGENTGPLAGVPVAVADNIMVAGMPATAGSRILEGFRPPADAFLVAQLRAAGALIVGKANLEEFGVKDAGFVFDGCDKCENIYPNLKDIYGRGGSVGVAAAVASGAARIGVAVDGDGGCRELASVTGTYVLKTSYGAVSRSGIAAVAPSLEQVALVARSPADLAAVFAVIQGRDDNDTATGILPPVDATRAVANGAEGLTTVGGGGADAWLLAQPVDGPLPAAHEIIFAAEAMSSLSRYDGVRFGRRAAGETLETLYTASRTEGFGPGIRELALRGAFVLSHRGFDRYYAQARRWRTVLAQAWARLFETGDVLIQPSVPDNAQLAANLVGAPSVTTSHGWEIFAAPGREDLVLRAAMAFFTAKDGNVRFPGRRSK